MKKIFKREKLLAEIEQVTGIDYSTYDFTDEMVALCWLENCRTKDSEINMMAKIHSSTELTKIPNYIR